MARTTITPEVVPSNTPLTIEPVVWVTGDNVNGNQFVPTGREILLVWNAHASLAKTFTPTSIAVNGRQDPKSGVAQSIAFGVIQLYNFRGEGWKQTDGFIYLDCESTDIKFLVITNPA